MYRFNQAFNVGPDNTVNGIKFVVRNHNNEIIYSTEEYQEQGGMGIVEIELPSNVFQGSIWVLRATDEQPLDVIAINPSDLYSIADAGSNIYSITLWVVDSRNKGIVGATVELSSMLVGSVIKGVGPSGFVVFYTTNGDYKIIVRNNGLQVFSGDISLSNQSRFMVITLDET